MTQSPADTSRSDPDARPARPLPKRTWLLLAIVGIVVVALVLTQLGRSHPAPSITAYRGLATWVDVYDARAWANPRTAVKDMADHGVRTLFLQTGNSSEASALFDRRSEESFIRAAHARGMKVVAWYLPDMVDVTRDYGRVAEAIRFETSDGQHFDGFALDIESQSVADEGERNRALATLTQKIRTLAGSSYALGAIIPSPVAIAKRAGFWDTFPYESVAKNYDVLLPMGYYTLNGTGAAAASADALTNMRILRAQRGCADVPVHLIGGLAEKSTSAEVAAFAEAARGSGCIGASLYSWAGTTSAEWRALGDVTP